MFNEDISEPNFPLAQPQDISEPIFPLAHPQDISEHDFGPYDISDQKVEFHDKTELQKSKK